MTIKKINNMTEKNLVEVVVLSKDFAENNLEKIMEIEKDYPHHWEKKNFLADLPEKWELSRYASFNEDLAGFIIASHKSECFYIHRFMTHRNFRGKGIGKILHLNFEDYCRKTGKSDNICLRVYTDNLKAIGFYHSLDYGIISREKDLVEGDRYIMKKSL